MWVYRWKKKYPGLLPNEPTEPPGADMGKGGRRAAFDDEDYAALGEALKTFLNNNPMGIDAPTLSPVIYGIVDENPKWRSQMEGPSPCPGRGCLRRWQVGAPPPKGD